MPLIIRDKDKKTPLWVKHPDTDVAALKVQLPAGFSIDACPSTRSPATRIFKAERSVRRRSMDFLLSCNARSQCERFFRPAHGTVATYPLGPIATCKDYLIDTPSFGGNSEAPVVIVRRQDPDQEKSPQQPKIIGLISGMQRETDKATLELAELTFHYPLGLSIVVPGEYIRQTLDRVPRGNPSAVEKKAAPANPRRNSVVIHK